MLVSRWPATAIGGLFSLLAITLATVPAAAQPLGTGLIPQEVAAQHGLKRAWAMQVSLDRSRDRLASLTLAGDTLYAQTVRGVVQAIDVRTGAPRWRTALGNPRYPSFAPAANDRFTAIVNGSMLFLLDRHTARVLTEFQMESIAVAPLAMDERRVYALLSNGFMVSYELEAELEPAAGEALVGDEGAAGEHDAAGDRSSDEFRPSEAFPLRSRSLGTPQARPLAFPGFVAWTTDAGRMYVFDLEQQSLLFEFRAQGEIVSGVDVRAPNLFFCSRDGNAYAVNIESGRMQWRFPSLHPINHPPVVIDATVYVFPRNGGIIALGADDGEPRWHAAEADAFIAASPSRIYTADRLQNLVVIDREQGQPLSRLPLGMLRLRMLNRHDDRLYLATDTGMVQCLHEIGLDQPVVHPRLVEAPKEHASGDDAGRAPSAAPSADDAAPDTDPMADADEAF